MMKKKKKVCKIVFFTKAFFTRTEADVNFRMFDKPSV